MRFSKLLAQSLVWRGLYFITLFFVNLLLSRYLQAAVSGVVYYISNTFVFVQLIVGLCLENGITYFGAGKRITPNKLLWFCLLWTSVLILLQLLVFHFFSFANSGFTAQKIAQYAFCFITGLLLTTYCASIFYASGNFLLPNLILSFFNVLFIAYVLIEYDLRRQAGKEAIVDFYFYTILWQGILIMIACLIKNKSWREFSLPSLPDIKRLARYSLTVLLFNVLLFLVYRIDYYFVRYSAVCTAADLGNYIQASKLGQMLLVIPQIIGSAVYPQVSSGKDMPAVSRAIIILIKWIAIVFIALFFAVLFAGNWLFPFLFGATFYKVRLPLLLLLPGIYGLSIISFLSNFFSGQGNVGISVRAALVALLVVVTGDFLFVSRYGIVAAAIVSSVGYLVMFSPYLIHFTKESGLSYKDYFRLQKDDFILLKLFLKKGRTKTDSEE